MILLGRYRSYNLLILNDFRTYTQKLCTFIYKSPELSNQGIRISFHGAIRYECFHPAWTTYPGRPPSRRNPATADFSCLHCHKAGVPSAPNTRNGQDPAMTAGEIREPRRYISGEGKTSRRRDCWVIKTTNGPAASTDRPILTETRFKGARHG